MLKWFSPKKLLKMDIQDYISYMSKFVRNIILIFFVIVIFFTIFACTQSENVMDFFEKSAPFYRILFGFGIIFTLLMLFIQSCMTRKHKQSEFDLHKSHKALDLIYNWCKDSTPEMLLARKIVDGLKVEELKKLADGNEPISVKEKDFDMLSGFLPRNIKSKKSKPSCKTKKKNLKNHKISDRKKSCPFADNCEVANLHMLSLSETLWLRTWVLKYLNLLEVIMYAWKSNIVDRKIMEKEFSYLVRTERDGSAVLEDFRKILGQENYLGIYSFCEYMSKENTKKIVEQEIGG